MHHLTEEQFYGGMAILIVGIIVLAASYILHMRKIDRGILEEDRRRLKAIAEEYAEKKARQLFEEYVREMRINFKVQCINESDMDWGEDK